MSDFSDTVVRRLSARTQAESSRKAILQGDLSAVQFPDVLTFVSLIRHTGRLVCNHQDTQRVILWSEGEVAFATSNSKHDSLGAFLLRNGKISDEQYQESLAKLTPGMRHGKLLVQLGFISPKDLWWGVRHQVLEIIYSLFSWKEGSFALYEGEADVDERIKLSMNTSSIIMEGIRRIDESALIREKIPSLTMVFRPVRGAAAMVADMELNEHEMVLFEQIDGKRTVRDLVRNVDLTEFEVLQILYQLISARVIEPVEEAEPEVLSSEEEDISDLLNIIEKYNLMFGRLHEAVSDAVGQARARELFVNALRNSESNELWHGVQFDQNGRFDENLLIANISELPTEQRKTVLDEGLNTLLSAQLFEVSPHLPPGSKSDVFRFISDQKLQPPARR